MTTAAWVVLISVLLLVSKLKPLVPSKRDRQRARLRQHAYLQGLQVRLVNKENVANNYPQKHEPVCYLLPLQKKEERPEFFLLRSVEQENSYSWEGNLTEELQQEIIILFEPLSVRVYGLEASREGLAVHWDESGDVERVESIKQVLLSISQILPILNEKK